MKDTVQKKKCICDEKNGSCSVLNRDEFKNEIKKVGKFKEVNAAFIIYQLLKIHVKFRSGFLCNV